MTTDGAFKGRRAVVFGGEGFLGSHLVAGLADSGASVLSYDLGAPAEPSVGGVERVTADILDMREVEDAIRGAEFVFAFAGGLGARGSLANPIRDLRTSCEAQLVLLDAVARLAPRAAVVLPGSRLEYGKPRYLPVDECHPLSGDSPYAIHKIACASYYRMYAESFGLRTVVLRLPNPYGAHTPGAPEQNLYGIVNIFIDQALRGVPIRLYGGGGQLRDFVHVDDVVRAVLMAATSSCVAGRVLNIGSGEPHSLAEVAELVVRAAGGGRVDASADWPIDAEAVETGDFYFDVSRAREVLGWEPTIGLEEGISRVVEQSAGPARRV